MYTIAPFLMHHYSLCMAILGTTIIGITAGIIGVFAFLRKHSLVGDTLSHASLPGIALTFLIAQSKNPLLLLVGGSISGILGIICMTIIARTTRLHIDTTLGIILSVFFGCGLILITEVQKSPHADQALLTKCMFGNASTLLIHDIYLMCSVSLLVLTVIFLLWKEFSLITFDAALAHCLGYRVLVLECVITFLLIITICAALQTMGIMLMSSMLIAPAAAARQWTQRLSVMVLLAALVGASATIIGSIISSLSAVPTGPAIVLVVTFITACSFIAAPSRVTQ